MPATPSIFGRVDAMQNLAAPPHEHALFLFPDEGSRRTVVLQDADVRVHHEHGHWHRIE
jgi:hypothetical protein